jgi:Homeodomain-like domain
MMKPPVDVRTLTEDDRRQLEAARRSADAFRRRRAQLILASARGLSPPPIARLVGCCVQTVGNVLQAFTTSRRACLSKLSTRPKRVEPTLNATHGERLPHLLHQLPRT